jgi:hypothetical protein
MSKIAINGIVRDMTAEEISTYELDQQTNRFQMAMETLRGTRNSLLSETDYLALSDQIMSAEMTTYRQALRDITNGLTTVADVEAVVFPEKPEASE